MEEQNLYLLHILNWRSYINIYGNNNDNSQVKRASWDLHNILKNSIYKHSMYQIS